MAEEEELVEVAEKLDEAEVEEQTETATESKPEAADTTVQPTDETADTTVQLEKVEEEEIELQKEELSEDLSEESTDDNAAVAKTETELSSEKLDEIPEKVPSASSALGSIGEGEVYSDYEEGEGGGEGVLDEEYLAGKVDEIERELEAMAGGIMGDAEGGDFTPKAMRFDDTVKVHEIDDSMEPPDIMQVGSYLAVIDMGDDDEDAMSDEVKKEEGADEFVLDFDFVEEEEEEVEEESEETITPLDRDALSQYYLVLIRNYGEIKRMNNFLHKKMADYFIKRKMEHVTYETDHSEDALLKYAIRMDQYQELIKIDKIKREKVNAEVNIMKKERDIITKEAAKSFEKMVQRERVVGTGLISSKTGKEMPDKALEKMIHIQVSKAKEMQLLRLTHIKIRNGIANKTASIRKLDKVGDKYTLIEFEQLKMENQVHADKIEERDEELSKLRSKCNGAIQALAHIKEKCSAIEIEMATLRADMSDKERDKNIVREELNKLKMIRDNLRSDTVRMKVNSGLLTKDKLLIDMEDSMKESEMIRKDIEQTEATYKRIVSKIRSVNKDLENEQRKDDYMRKHPPEKSFKVHKLLKQRRPTMIQPRFVDSEGNFID